jgi:hypothetical protein
MGGVVSYYTFNESVRTVGPAWALHFQRVGTDCWSGLGLQIGNVFPYCNA